jgi:hypothetical protein
MAGVALAENPHDTLVPTVTETRLLAWGGAQILFVGIQTPYKEGMYRVKYVIFNHKGERVRSSNSEWFVWQSGPYIGYETEVTPRLKGEGYYVRAIVKYAEWIDNER